MSTFLRYQFNAQTHFSPTAAGHEPHAAVCDKPAFQGFRVVWCQNLQPQRWGRLSTLTAYLG
jgi:hypothetical protein